MTNTPILRADVEFGHDRALGRIARSFTPGKLYGITGPNGSGKSTLLQTLSGELEPKSGTVDIDGSDPASHRGAGKILRVGDPVFYPDLSVGEHFELLSKRSTTGAEKLGELWSLGPLLDCPPRWLSSGQRQRVFLASQLYLPASALLIDEPERHLDHLWEEFLIEQLRERAAKGVIVIVASHSTAVLSACDETVTLP